MNNKKLTLKDFFTSDSKLVIHCDTKEKADKLLKAFDDYGMCWYGGERYIDLNEWSRYKEETCYSNMSGFGFVKFYKKKGIKIYEFEDVDLEDSYIC